MLDGIVDRLRSALKLNPQPTQTFKEKDLDLQLSKMPVPYKNLFVEVAATTPHILEAIDSKTKIILHHVHSLVVDERGGHCFNPERHGLGYLVGYGLAKLREYSGDPEYRHLWENTKFVHPTQKGIQIHDELGAQGYDFAPPKGAFFDVD